MTKQELLSRLLVLNKDYKFVVWDITGDYYGETNPEVRCGYRLDWTTENVCPTEEEIYSVSQQQLNAYYENENDKTLLNRYENDLQMKMLYKLEKQTVPDLTYLDFIKNAINYDTKQ